MIVAVLLRLVALGARVMHHDESLDAWWAWMYSTGRGYEYDPVYHGPLRIIVTGGLFELFGASDTVARLLPAICGLALIGVPWMIRSTLGRVGTVAAAIAIALSPSLVYFSRFGREDMTFAFLASVFSLGVVEHLRRPRPWLPVAIGASAAAAAAVKESIAITAFVLFVYLVALAVWEWRRDPDTTWGGRPLWRVLTALGPRPWLIGSGVFVAIYVVSYSVFFTDPGGVWRGLYDGPKYWLLQHEVGRGSQPWTYYTHIVTAYEWPILILAAIGAVAALRRPTKVGVFLVWSAVSQYVIYSWAGERYPWLVVHIVVPLCLLAGLGVRSVWGVREEVLGRVGLALGFVAVVWMVAVTYVTSHVRSADPRELLVAVQTAPDVRDALAEVDRVVEAAAADGRTASVLVDSDDSGSWPLAWYLRDTPGVGFQSFAGGTATPYDAALVMDANMAVTNPDPERHDLVAFEFRRTWLPDYGGASVRDWGDWYARREVWNAPQVVYMWLVVAREAPR
ncbi:flippase activity-associated protein Agl23 [Ilumatobacter sp.]|uniref:flippase activity-associated protein Agl23 n=1 Tax=Ilumatobacter sp. TaxID=1967498 RepID=UPI003299A695